MSKKLLILGSTGFIGKNAVNYFMSKGYDVHCADIVIKEEKNYTVINSEATDFSILFSNQSYDICINATGAASVPLSFLYPAIDYSLNVSNVFNILEAIRKYSPECKFINFSSAAVYGNPTAIPIGEDSAINPMSPYGFHKYYSEMVCREFYETFKIPTLSLRIFSAYGEGLKKQLFWDVYNKIENSKNSEIILFGTGSESRDFIYISDLLKAIEFLIDRVTFCGNTVNIASGKEITIREAVEIFVNYVNSGIKTIYNNENKLGDPRNWRADVSELSSRGFKWEYDIHRGLKNYANWITTLNRND
jgi:UDP-glucose 4-epimerase